MILFQSTRVARRATRACQLRFPSCRVSIHARRATRDDQERRTCGVVVVSIHARRATSRRRCGRTAGWPRFNPRASRDARP